MRGLSVVCALAASPVSAAIEPPDKSLTQGAPEGQAMRSAIVDPPAATPPPTVDGSPTPAIPPVASLPARGAENAISQAEDAFGFSSGKETLGLYTTSNVRGFSPAAAGNIRIDGLYFDQVFGLSNRVRESTSIRVGLSALGVPFPAPTGIVDYRLYRPGDLGEHSALVNVDSYGMATAETDFMLPLVRERLSMGGGVYVASTQQPDGTGAHWNIQGLTLRWRPASTLDLMPFWTRHEIADDERGPRYIPGGPFLPPPVSDRSYPGPRWADYNNVGMTYGMVSSWRPDAAWLIRAGLFRSSMDDASDFAHLLRNVQPDGSARRTIIWDPPAKASSVSGELRVSRMFEGSVGLRHTVHLSLSGRARREIYAGSDIIDFGPGNIYDVFEPPEPEFQATPQSRDRVRQLTGGIAYDGRWPNVLEVSTGLARATYRKDVQIPGLISGSTRASPWLFYGSVTGRLTGRLALYASYTRGLEESGIAPDNALNRGQPLAAILTSQREVGARYALSPQLNVSASLFELSKPYYNLNAVNEFTRLGDVRNRGLEVSVSGSATSRLKLVSGAVLLQPRVLGEGVRLGRVGARPIGLPSRSIMLNLDWQPPGTTGLSVDLGVSHNSRIISTLDNRVAIPARTLIDIGGRYGFNLAGKNATLRARLTNIANLEGFQLQGAGAYDIIQGRLLNVYLAVNF